MNKLRLWTVIVFLACIITLIPGIMNNHKGLIYIGIVFLIIGLILRLLRYLYMK